MTPVQFRIHGTRHVIAERQQRHSAIHHCMIITAFINSAGQTSACVTGETQVAGSADTSLSLGFGQPSVPDDVPSEALPLT